ncbi:MAG: GTPase HflX [Saprospiraceae bacterium]|nr:GTPase HflX [Saprospiraceae bacterium]
MTEWKVGKQKKSGLDKGPEKALLVGVVRFPFTEEQVDEYLAELSFLAETAGAKTIKVFKQKLNSPDQKTFVGSGKIQEIHEYAERCDADLIIFDDDLSGKQQSNLEKLFKRKIVDRSSLILDIFANRAQTAQAKAQVELAQMQYLLPRLRGMWQHLERQRGGIGMRGPGEKEIETDRRIVRDKISQLRQRLEKIDQQSRTQRKNRGELVRVSLVGYTNAGKSTLMNRLAKTDVFAEDKLFATLDTTVRKVVLDRMPFLLSDTVGFIRKLPHHLVESFKSTLDETRESDLLLHVVDVSHPHFTDHIMTVQKTLEELGAIDVPTIMVFNKIDRYRSKAFDALLPESTRVELEEAFKESLGKQYEESVIFVSALDGEGLGEMREFLKSRIKEIYLERYPYKAVHF